MFHVRNEVIKILENKDYELWNGDCLELIKQVPNESVDLILTDPPYENIIEELSTNEKSRYGYVDIILDSLEKDCNIPKEYFNSEKKQFYITTICPFSNCDFSLNVNAATMITINKN